jgi:C4-dicarboxylate transporter DctQ subunit
VVMMLIVVVNILLRAVWKPIGGTYDFVYILTGIMIPLALANCAIKRGYPAISVLIDRFPQRTQAIVDSIVSILSVGFFAVASWQLAVLGTVIWKTNELLPTLRVPYYPLVFLSSLCCVVVLLVLLLELLKSIVQAVKK